MLSPRALSANPPICVHEPILRRGLEAAQRLIWGHAYQSGDPSDMVCEHNIARSIPCAPCDRQHVAAALDLLAHQRPPLANECLAPQMIEQRAAIQGLVSEVVGLRHALRESGGALKRALGEREGVWK